MSKKKRQHEQKQRQHHVVLFYFPHSQRVDLQAAAMMRRSAAPLILWSPLLSGHRTNRVPATVPKDGVVAHRAPVP
jgi:hypothetical protein